MSYISMSAPENPAVRPYYEHEVRQREIRRVLRLNEKKKLSGKQRGRKWVLAKRAECAILGHLSTTRGGCFYCGAKLT